MLRNPECAGRREKRRGEREEIGGGRRGKVSSRRRGGCRRSFPPSAVVSISAERFTALHPRTSCPAVEKSPRDTGNSLESNWIPAGRQWHGERGVLRHRRPFFVADPSSRTHARRHLERFHGGTGANRSAAIGSIAIKDEIVYLLYASYR